MGATEERLKVLQMLEDGKITPEEAASLLRALGRGQEEVGSGGFAAATENRFLRIRVTDTASGTSKVNVTIPLGLVGVGLRIAERFAPDAKGVDVKELEQTILGGAQGKVMEVMDTEDNERVEIYVE